MAKDRERSDGGMPEIDPGLEAAIRQVTQPEQSDEVLYRAARALEAGRQPEPAQPTASEQSPERPRRSPRFNPDRVAKSVLDGLGGWLLLTGAAAMIEGNAIIAVLGVVSGLVLLGAGLSYGHWKHLLSEEWRQAISRAAMRYWLPAVLVFAFLVSAPVVYRFAVSPAAQVTALSGAHIFSWGLVLSRMGPRTVSITYTANASEADRLAMIAAFREAKWNVPPSVGLTVKAEGTRVHYAEGDNLDALVPFMYLLDRSTNFYSDKKLEPGHISIIFAAPWKNPDAR